ncbi:MAG: glycosyltransferase, partial [Chloroflexota bacterium]
PGDHAGMAAQLAWAQAHPDEMAAFGQSARKRFEARYTADASHRRLLEIYSIALERAAGRAAAG